MFLGESLAGFVYLFEQKLLKRNKENNKNNEIVMKQFERIDKKQNIKRRKESSLRKLKNEILIINYYFYFLCNSYFKIL